MSVLCETQSFPLPIYDQREEMVLRKFTIMITKKDKKYSVICKSILNNKICSHGSRCRFAHSKQEFTPVSCRHGYLCKNKLCVYRHNESIDEYCNRLHINIS
jgi:hypothetical protein